MSALRLGCSATIAVLAVTSCAHERTERPASATVTASAKAPATTPISFPASRIVAGGVPGISAAQIAAVRAVRAASTPADRPKLIVSFPHGVDGDVRGTMVLSYGDPRYPDGVIPGAGTTAEHVIGGVCNLYYRASDGLEFTAPGDGSGCATWKDSAADITARRYGLGD